MEYAQFMKVFSESSLKLTTKIAPRYTIGRKKHFHYNITMYSINDQQTGVVYNKMHII